MNIPGKFKPVRLHTFIYGLSDESGLSALIASSEENGCEFLQAIACTIPDPRPPSLLVPGQAPRPAMLRAFQILVRLPAADFPALLEKLKALQAGVMS